MKTLCRIWTLLLFAFLISATLPSCSAVKPYQRAYLNDAEMSFGAMKSESFEVKAIYYREGTLDLIKGKSSGGCGCN